MKDSVEQLMAGCVDETCVHSLRLHCGTPGSVENNELRRCLSLAIFFSMDIISPDLDSFRAAAVGVGV